MAAQVNREANAALIEAWAAPRFEVIPLAGVEEQAGYLPRGRTVTVTCSPARGIEYTLAHVERLSELRLRVVPHLSARLVSGEAQLREILRRLEGLGLREVFVVGGDAHEPRGPYPGALDLLRAMAENEHSLNEIGVAAYPERHPLIDDATLWQALASKQPYATYMVTQICFDAPTIIRWLEAARGQGITLPVYIGIPGVVDSARLLRVAMKIGVGDSMRFLSKHVGVAARLLRPGHYRPDELVAGLAPYFGDPAYGLRGLHVNTFNQVERTEQWRRQMLHRLAAV